MKDENRSEDVSSSFIPHPSSFKTPLHPCKESITIFSPSKLIDHVELHAVQIAIEG